MKLNTLILALALVSSISLFTSTVYGQQPTPEQNRADSMQRISIQKTQKELDHDRMSLAKSERKATKAKAKEARRVQGEADDADRETKNALLAEKKAQKQRMKADKQAKRAEESRTISNKN